MGSVKLNRMQAQSGDLPLVCVYCGCYSTNHLRHVFIGRTPFTIGPRTGILQARLPVCPRHCQKAFLRALAQQLLLALCALFLALVLAVQLLSGRTSFLEGLSSHQNDIWRLLLMSCGLFAVVRFLLFYSDVRVSAASPKTLLLDGVSDRFVSAYREQLVADRSATPVSGSADEASGTDSLKKHSR